MKVSLSFKILLVLFILAQASWQQVACPTDTDMYQFCSSCNQSTGNASCTCNSNKFPLGNACFPISDGCIYSR